MYERHFSLLRNHADAVAEAARARAQADPDYARVHREARSLDPKIEYARLRLDRATVTELTRRKKALVAEEAACLARLHMTAADLVPKYRCKKCSDTGYLKDGHMCDCGRPPKGARR